MWLLTIVKSHFDKKPGDTTDIQEIGEASLSDLNTHEGLIVGVPTWHTGADTERSGTDWDSLLDDIKDLDVPANGQKVETRTCVLDRDVEFALVSTHTHERGDCATLRPNTDPPRHGLLRGADELLWSLS